MPFIRVLLYSQCRALAALGWCRPPQHSSMSVEAVLNEPLAGI